jgi:hypothetical protein
MNMRVSYRPTFAAVCAVVTGAGFASGACRISNGSLVTISQTSVENL